MDQLRRVTDFRYGRIPREHPDYDKLAKLSASMNEDEARQQDEPLFNGNDEPDCCICLKNLQESPNIRVPCNHIFHIACIDDWIARQMQQQQNPLCPMCKRCVFT